MESIRLRISIYNDCFKGFFLIDFRITVRSL